MDDLKLALSKMRGIHEYMDVSSPSNVDWLILNLQNENIHHPFYEGVMKELLAIKIKFTLFGVADEKAS